MLCIKFLESQARYGEAAGKMLAISSNFGEEFQRDADLNQVTNEIQATWQLLEGVMVETILNLPTIEYRRNWTVMKFIDHEFLVYLY